MTPYRLVSPNFRVIFDITLNVLPPDDRMIFLRFEELRNIFGPRLDCIEPFLAEYAGQVSLDSSDGSRSEVVTKNPECRGGLMTV